ncbi:hypothetical protein V8C37DRAFT_349780 [Trichoderma ceciliae]
MGLWPVIPSLRFSHDIIFFPRLLPCTQSFKWSTKIKPRLAPPTPARLSERELILQRLAPNAQSDVPSDKTNPHTSAELERISRHLANGGTQDESQNEHSDTIRVTLEPGQDSIFHLEVLSIGTSDEECPRRLVAAGQNATSRAPTDYVKKVTLAQSHNDIGYNIKTAALSQDLEGAQGTPPGAAFLLQIFFDPNSDRIILVNMTKRPRIKVEMASTPATGPVMFTYLHKSLLDVGSWIIHLGDQHLLNITVLPRRYVSILQEVRSKKPKSAKRMLELSQPATSTAKKGKKEAANDKSDEVAVFQQAPAYKPTRYIPTSVDTSEGEIASSMRHPLDLLQVGDAAKITGARGEDYSLTRQENIVLSKKTLVFKAQHSDRSGELVAVKVFRTTPDPDDDTIPFRTVMCARYWQVEATNHFKVSDHVS